MGRVEIVTLTVGARAKEGKGPPPRSLLTRPISSSLREVSTSRFREQIARSKKTPVMQANSPSSIFARPNPKHICACAWIYRWTKKLSKIRTGPPGLRAAGPLGLWVAEPPGCRTSGPRGRRGPWAAGRWAVGLPLAKPLR